MYAPIQQWAPDADDTAIGVLPMVENMVPTMRGYAGASTPTASTLPALAAECRGAATVQILDGTSYLFAGTQTKLYKASSSSWDDVSVLGDYTGSSSSRWCFTQFGNVTLAVNKVDDSQYYLHGTSTDFADVSGMPKAAFVESVGQFVLIANYNDGTDTPNGWGCSAIGDYTDWTPDPDTQSAYGQLNDTVGPLTGLKRLQDYAVFYKQRSMYLARYVGQPFIWEFSLVSDIVGAVSNDSIVRVGQRHYFCGDDDFYVFDAANIQPIGRPIREWFSGEVNQSKKNLITAAHDELNGVIRWYYPAGSSSTPTEWVAYNYLSNKWGRGTGAVEATVTYVTPGMSYDEVETSYTTYDAIDSLPMDSIAPSGQTKQPSIINTSHALQILNGAAEDSSLTTNDIGTDGSLMLMTRVRPRYLVSPDSATMTHYYKDDLGSSPGISTTTDQVSGKFDLLKTARWHRLKVSFNGPVEIVGADVSTQVDGLE